MEKNTVRKTTQQKYFEILEEIYKLPVIDSHQIMGILVKRKADKSLLNRMVGCGFLLGQRGSYIWNTSAPTIEMGKKLAIHRSRYNEERAKHKLSNKGLPFVSHTPIQAHTPTDQILNLLCERTINDDNAVRVKRWLERNGYEVLISKTVKVEI